MSRPAGGWSDEILNAARGRADPVAHNVVQAIFDQGADRLSEANRLLVNVPPNSELPPMANVAPELAQALETFLRTTAKLPDWADADRIRRAEETFFDHGILAILTLFNASLPECYVVRPVAEVLQIAGQLVDRAEYRIRATARMIIPVMAHGGLTAPRGYGIGHLQRVRLIHATIRHLIVAGKQATDEMEAASVRPTPNSALGSAVMPKDLREAMLAAGWDEEVDGAPINQEELAYVLLTFSYVSVRTFRMLGLRLSRQQEEDYLHCWNVAGFVLGVERQLMADTMDEAEELFQRIRQRAREHPRHMADPRHALAVALIRVIERHIPWPTLRPLGALLPRLLIGDESAGILRIDAHVTRRTRFAFALVRVAITSWEWVLQGLLRHVSLYRFISRVLGYHLFKGLLMDQTRPLVLPDECLHPLVHRWEKDPQHPRWVNWVERRFTGQALHRMMSRPGR